MEKSLQDHLRERVRSQLANQKGSNKVPIKKLNFKSPIVSYDVDTNMAQMNYNRNTLVQRDTIKGNESSHPSSLDSFESSDFSTSKDEDTQKDVVDTLVRQDFINIMPSLRFSDYNYSQDCSDTYDYLKELQNSQKFDHNIMNLHQDDAKFCRNFAFEYSNKNKILFYSNSGNIKEFMIQHGMEAKQEYALCLSDLNYQFFLNFRLWTEDLIVVRLQMFLQVVKFCPEKKRFAIEVGSHPLNSRTDYNLSAYPQFGLEPGTIFIDTDINTLAKLKFQKSQDLKLKCEYKNMQREIGNFVTINLEKQVWIYYLPNPNENREGYFQVVDQEELKPLGIPLQCGWRRMSTLKASCTDNLVFSGFTNGDIIIWETSTRVIKQHFTGTINKPVTCIAQFDNFLACGANKDKAICVWDIQEGKLTNWIEYEHNVLNLFLYGSQLIICHPTGVQKISGVYFKGFKCIKAHKNVTSKNIEFFKDGENFIVGCKQSILVKSSLSQYESFNHEMSLNLENSIQTIQLNRNESHVYVSTNKSPKSVKRAGIYQVNAIDFTINQIYPQYGPFEFQSFKVVSTFEGDHVIDKIIASGAFGLMIFDCFNPENRIKIQEFQFQGINFDEIRGLVVAGTQDHIKFYRMEQETEVNIHGIQQDISIEDVHTKCGNNIANALTGTDTDKKEIDTDQKDSGSMRNGGDHINLTPLDKGLQKRASANYGRTVTFQPRSSHKESTPLNKNSEIDAEIINEYKDQEIDDEKVQEVDNDDDDDKNQEVDETRQTEVLDTFAPLQSTSRQFFDFSKDTQFKEASKDTSQFKNASNASIDDKEDKQGNENEGGDQLADHNEQLDLAIETKKFKKPITHNEGMFQRANTLELQNIRPRRNTHKNKQWRKREASNELKRQKCVTKKQFIEKDPSADGLDKEMSRSHSSFKDSSVMSNAESKKDSASRSNSKSIGASVRKLSALKEIIFEKKRSSFSNLFEMLQLQTFQQHQTIMARKRKDILVKHLEGKLSELAISCYQKFDDMNEAGNRALCKKCSSTFFCRNRNSQNTNSKIEWKTSPEMMFMAQGDSKGLIQVWKLAELHYNEPIANIQYSGQVVDIKFIQNKRTQLMLSLHNQPGQLYVTSLINFKLIRMVQLNFVSQSISVHPNNRMVFIVPLNDKNLDMAVIDLGFKLNNSEVKYHCLRDIMLMQFLKGYQDHQTEMLEVMLNSDNLSCLDALNSINILNACANIHKNSQMEMLLRSKVPCLQDSRKKSISDYVIESSNVLGIQVLFNFINTNQMEIEMATMIYALKKDPGWISDYAPEKLFVNAKIGAGVEKMILGKLKNEKDLCIFQSLSNYVSINMIEEHIDQDSTDKQEISIKVSFIPFNLESGSNSSLDLLEQIQMLHDEAFYTDFSKIIQFKWLQDSIYAKILASMHLMFVLLLDYQVVLMKQNGENGPRINGLSWITLSLDIILCLYETAQLYFEGFKNYFGDVENYLDGLGQLFYIIYFIILSNVEPLPKSEDDDNGMDRRDNVILAILSLCVLLLNLRMAEHLSVFSKKIRTMMIVIVSAIFDMVYFLFILYMLVMILALANFVINDKNLTLTIIEEYQLIFGDNPKASVVYSENWLIGFLYVAGTNLIVVVCLNILISIVQDNYDSVQTRMQATNFKQKAKILRAIEEFLFWKRDSGSQKYIFLLQYRAVAADVDLTWQGKLRMLKSQIFDVQNVIRTRMAEVEQRSNEKIEQLENKIDMVNDQVQDVKEIVRQIYKEVQKKNDE